MWKVASGFVSVRVTRDVVPRPTAPKLVLPAVPVPESEIAATLFPDVIFRFAVLLVCR